MIYDISFHTQILCQAPFIKIYCIFLFFYLNPTWRNGWRTLFTWARGGGGDQPSWFRHSGSWEGLLLCDARRSYIFLNSSCLKCMPVEKVNRIIFYSSATDASKHPMGSVFRPRKGPQKLVGSYREDVADELESFLIDKNVNWTSSSTIIKICWLLLKIIILYPPIFCFLGGPNYQSENPD